MKRRPEKSEGWALGEEHSLQRPRGQVERRSDCAALGTRVRALPFVRSKLGSQQRAFFRRVTWSDLVSTGSHAVL